MRHWGQRAGLVRIAEHELAGFERPFLGIGAGNAASFDLRLTNTVPETEGLPLGVVDVAAKTIDHFDARGVITLLSAIEYGLEPILVGRDRRQGNVDIRGAKWFLPILGAVFAHVAYLLRAGCHALLKLRREAVEGLTRQAHRLESVKGEGDTHPGITCWTGGV